MSGETAARSFPARRASSSSAPASPEIEKSIRTVVTTKIKDLAVEGWTLVIVTHEIQFARQVSTQVLFTDQGVILEQGPPAEVIGNPKEERTRQFLERVLNPL